MGTAGLARGGTQASALASKEHREGLARAWQLCSDPTQTQRDGGSSPSALWTQRERETNKKKARRELKPKGKFRWKEGTNPSPLS